MPITCANCNAAKGNLPAILNKWYQCCCCGKMYCPKCGENFTSVKGDKSMKNSPCCSDAQVKPIG